MIKIMFVCHGNICRSPMAEFIMKDLAVKANVEDEFVIRSSATSTEEIYRGVGNPIYPPAAAELTRRGVPFTKRQAVQLAAEDCGKYDIFVGMDSANIRNMIRILGKDADKRIFKLLSFTGSDRDVSDPWYSDRFDIAFDDIYKGCHALFERILKSRNENEDLRTELF